MLPMSCPPSALTGPEGGARTLDKAGNAAEAAYEMQRAGKPRRCCRGAGLVTAEKCMERFRAGKAPCVTPQHGRCSTGLIEDAKHLEDTMGTKSKIGPCANLACPDSQPGSRVKRYSHDLCCDCFKLWKSGELVWPPAKLQVQPKTAEAPAEATISGQEETPAKPAVVVAQEEISARVKIPERTYAEIREDLEKALKSSGVTPAERDALARTMKDDADPDYPEDLDRPFSIAGVDFTPPPPAEPVTPPLFSVRNKDLCAFNKAAVLRFGLDVYSYARVILSVDGQSIGIKFYVRERNGAIRVQHRQSREVVISSREFVRSAEHLLRKKAVLEPTEWDGFFLARFGGQEAA